MATAIALNATSTILNGQGLGVSPALLANISTYQAKPALASFANCYVSAGNNGSVTANIIAELNTIGNTITSGQYLLDLFPSNVSPACSATITPWVANLIVAVGSLISYQGKIYTTTGNVYSESFDSNVITSTQLTGFSGLLNKQAQLPFASGYSGFANVVALTRGYSQQVFDTVSSISLLKNRTYSETGVNFTGPQDLVTNGLKNDAILIANVVANWGTMYDINNITSIGDPYVFGQNLLNQGLGYVNGLAEQLTNVGLDITNLPDVPAVRTTVTQEETTTTISSFVGEIEFPTVVERVITEPVTGSSPSVVLNIYRTVTGSNLSIVTSAANITTSSNSINQLLNLADYLDIQKVVPPNLYSALNVLNIRTFEDFGKYLSRKLGQARFKNWSDMSRFLRTLENPSLSNLPSGANTKILYNTTVTTLTNQFGTGSGALGNPVMVDYLGACAGDPYSNRFYFINNNYDSLTTASGLTTALSNLNKAIVDYCNAYTLYEGSGTPESSPGAGDGTPPDPGLLPSFATITANVAAVNTALSSVPSTGILVEKAAICNTSWFEMLNRISTEVANLNRAGVVFGPGTTLGLLAFAENIGQTASDKTQAEGYQFFANLITNDVAGDTIRAVVAETLNTRALQNVGIDIYNNPDPRLKIAQSQAQNVPLSTYLTQNK